jgi:hypothetical protein
MTARLLIDAVLDKPPVRLTSKAGKPYLRASARDGKGPDAKWWTIFVFSETAIEALEALTVGEAFAATGTFEASVWAPEGREPRVNLTMNADAILSARKPKPAKPARQSEASNTDGRSIAARSWAAPRADEPPRGNAPVMDGDIPFMCEWR